MNNQHGQTSIIVIVLILIGGLVLFSQSTGRNANSVQNTENQTCVSVPDPAFSATYNSIRYNRIRSATAVPAGELSYHLDDVGLIMANGGQSEGYIVKQDTIRRGQPTSITFDEEAFNLLYVDVTDKISDQTIGYKYFEIYLKENTPIPKFISDYCNASLPISSIPILPDANGSTTPPLSFNTNQISFTVPANHTAPTPDAVYFLFSYDKGGGHTQDYYNSYRVVAAPMWPEGVLTVVTSRGPKVYKAVYVDGSVIHYIALLDTDPNSPDYDIAYKYVGSSALAPFTSPMPTGGNTSFSALQMKSLAMLDLKPWGWWSPECKPAIYLYPEKAEKVNVQVKPKGYLTYTDPIYPSSGWEVIAYPDGKIQNQEKSYDYLYYESKIRDTEINKPKQGYVIAFEELSNFYDQVLPKLGLSQKETKDFKDYWLKVLPKSSYYFIGVMSEKDIDNIEPLNVKPLPSTIIRVRLYFEALEQKIEVKKPEIITPKRNGFTLVEWGGIVKVDKNHPFTCSM